MGRKPSLIRNIRNHWIYPFTCGAVDSGQSNLPTYQNPGRVICIPKHRGSVHSWGCGHQRFASTLFRNLTSDTSDPSNEGVDDDAHGLRVLPCLLQLESVRR